MTRLKEAKKQIIKQFNIDPDDYLPKNDLDAWEKNKSINFLYNKMFICDFENLNNAPLPIEPPKYPIVIKPIINLYGMGLNSKIINNKKEFYDNWLSNNFWCEYLEGTHLSWDIVVRNGKIIYFVCFEGHKYSDSERFGCFSYWELINHNNITIFPNIKNLINKYLKNYTGNINLETINQKIIEVHLRMGDIDQLSVEIIKLVILNLVITDKKYDNIIKKAFIKYKPNKLKKIFLIPVWYKIKSNSDMLVVMQYLKQNWEKKIQDNQLIFFYYFDENNESFPGINKRCFLFSTEYYDQINKLKYDIEYDLIKNFG